MLFVVRGTLWLFVGKRDGGSYDFRLFVTCVLPIVVCFLLPVAIGRLSSVIIALPGHILHCFVWSLFVPHLSFFCCPSILLLLAFPV